MEDSDEDDDPFEEEEVEDDDLLLDGDKYWVYEIFGNANATFPSQIKERKTMPGLQLPCLPPNLNQLPNHLEHRWYYSI